MNIYEYTRGSEMELPNEFQFRTRSTDNISKAFKIKAGYLVHNHLFEEKRVKELIEEGAWIIVKEIPVKNIGAEMPTIEPLEDLINKPSHYHKNEIDVHGYLEKHFPKDANVTVAEGFYMGNIIKYVCRHKEKGGVQDLKKAMANLQALIALEDSNGSS
jgi:hypothetical protein